MDKRSAHTPTSSARSGVPGPGDSTTRAKCPAAMDGSNCFQHMASLRTTTGGTPSTAAMRWYRLYV